MQFRQRIPRAYADVAGRVNCHSIACVSIESQDAAAVIKYLPLFIAGCLVKHNTCGGSLYMGKSINARWARRTCRADADIAGPGIWKGVRLGHSSLRAARHGEEREAD